MLITYSVTRARQAYAKKHDLGEDLKEVALKVAAMPKKDESRPRTVIFTQGSGSTIVAYNGTVTEYAVDPLAKELLVDTNGAGDAFVGGFLSELVQGKDVEDCLRLVIGLPSTLFSSQEPLLMKHAHTRLKCCVQCLLY